MLRQPFLQIPRRSVSYLAICIGRLVAFALIGLVPSWRFLAQLDADTRRMGFQLEEQKILHPLYTQLLEMSTLNDSRLAEAPSRKELATDRIAQLGNLLGELAQKSNLLLISYLPDIKSPAGSPRFLLVQMDLKGDFRAFRGFLRELDSFPYLAGLEELSIQDSEGGRELKLKLRLALGEALSGEGVQ